MDPSRVQGVISAQVLLVDNSATITYDPGLLTEADIISAIEDLGFEATCVSKKSVPGRRTDGKDVQTHKSTTPIRDSSVEGYRLQLSIEGMTCASCTGAVSNLLKSMKGVKDYEVNLIGACGTVTVEAEELAATVQSEIEDLGYDCKIMSVEAINRVPDKQVGQEKDVSGVSMVDVRTVKIRIEGFFCEYCPAKANRVLEDLSERFDITFTPSTLDDPISTLTYTADPPAFTLRTIRSALTELGFSLAVVKPETLQDRARLAQKRERQRILLRLIICILFSIPTFIIGVVIASLLPSHHHLRMYFHQAVWGGANRITVSLFVLATPIQFGVGQFFYSRAYKSLRGVWRRRRGTVDMRKVWVDRLLRWGSMDTLVALGTTIAYLSSLAYMILDIVGIGNGEMAYFDTSVFLITFILAGRYLVSGLGSVCTPPTGARSRDCRLTQDPLFCPHDLQESISKARTGDAILELGKLRPKKGLLCSDSKSTEEVESEFIEPGDRLLVPVGQAPPVDCVLAPDSSSTSFDEASLTGESRPVAKKNGDPVYAGTINAGPSAAIAIVTKRDGETVIDSIASGVRDAMSKKASIERLADSITAVFVPVIVGIGCLTFVIWIIRAYSGNLPEDWLDTQKEGGWILFSLQFTVACLVVGKQKTFSTCGARGQCEECADLGFSLQLALVGLGLQRPPHSSLEWVSLLNTVSCPTAAGKRSSPSATSTPSHSTRLAPSPRENSRSRMSRNSVCWVQPSCGAV